MKRLLFIAPGALAVYVASRLVVPPDAEWVTFRIEVLIAAGLAALGCWFGLSRLRMGDYLRTAWGINFAAYLLVALSAYLRFPEHPSDARLLARGSVLIVENALLVAAMWLFARAYRVAGISLPGSRFRQITVGAAAAIVAVGIAGPSLWGELEKLAGGDVNAIAGVVSSLGDIVSTTLLAPILLTAVAMRGGLLVWPWAFMAASNFAWLLHDAQTLISPYLANSTGRVWSDLWRIMACVLMLPAGLAQRRLVGGVPVAASK